MFPRQSDVPSLFYPSSHPDKALQHRPQRWAWSGSRAKLKFLSKEIERLKAGYGHSEMGTLL